MTTSAFPGPLSITGQNPPIVGAVGYTGAQPALIDSNPDLAPSLIWAGIGIRDPRYLPRIGAGPLSPGGYASQDCGWYNPMGIIGTDYVPYTLEVNNIAANQHVTNGTPMTLVSSSGSGITVETAATTILPTGNVVPAGTLLIDTAPTWVGGGTSGAFAFFNPAAGGGRCVSITGVSGGAGGTFVVVGYDVYGVLVHQNIVVAAGVNTVNGTKALKWVLSVTPQVTDAHNYSVGTADIYGLPIYSSKFPATLINWAGTLQTANTGFTAGVTTTASATTGDVRGTYAVQSASNNSNRLTIYQAVDFSVIASTFAAAQQALLGVSQY